MLISRLVDGNIFKGGSAAQRGQETNLSPTMKASPANIRFPNKDKSQSCDFFLSAEANHLVSNVVFIEKQIKQHKARLRSAPHKLSQRLFGCSTTGAPALKQAATLEPVQICRSVNHSEAFGTDFKWYLDTNLRSSCSAETKKQKLKPYSGPRRQS